MNLVVLTSPRKTESYKMREICQLSYIDNQQIVFALQQVDNSTEFISKALDLRAYENNVTLDYSRPEKPTDKPYTESFNGRFREDVEFEL